MKKYSRIAYTVFGCILALFLLACSSRKDEQADTLQENDSQSQQENFEGLSYSELLQKALEWAEGKSIETLLSEYQKSVEADKEDPLRSWKYMVVLAKLVDAKGEEAAQKILDEIQVAHSKNKMPRSSQKHQRFYGALREYPEIYDIARSNPAEAISRINQLFVHPQVAEQLSVDVLDVYARSDPRAALKFLESRTDVKRERARSRIFSEWAETDPEAAISYLDQTPVSSERDEILSDILNRVAGNSLEKALELASNTQLSNGTNKIFKNIVERYIHEDIEGASAWLLSQDLSSQVLIDAGVDAFAAEYPEKAVEFLENIDPAYLKSEHIYRVSWSLAKKDFNTALDWVESSVSGEFREKALLSIFTTVANSSPDIIKPYLNDLGSIGLSRSSISSITRQFADKHPLEAIEWANTQSDSPMTANIFGNAAESLLEEKPEEIQNILEMIGEERYRVEVIDDILREWVKADFDAALAWATTRGLELNPEKALSPVAKLWVQNDLEAAEAFIRSLPSDTTQNQMLSGYISVRGKSDPVAVVSFINELELYKSTQSKVAYMIRDVGKKRPDQAKDLIESVKDPVARNRAINALTGELVKLDFEATGEWLAAIDMASDSNVQSTVRTFLKRVDDHTALDWIYKVSDTDIRDAAYAEVSVKIAPTDLTNAALLMNQAPSGNGRVSRIYSILRNLPDQATRDTFVNSLALNGEEQESLNKRRERGNL